MRYKKLNLKANRSKPLSIQFVKQDMTSYSGLIFIGHLMRLYQLHRKLRKKLSGLDFSGDYSVVDILLMIVVMLIVGAERLSHLEFLRDDPLFRRIIGITRIPHRTKVSQALKQFTSDSLKALIELNGELVCEHLNRLGLKTLTLDLDGTVLSTKGNPSWAFKGYNPIKKGAKSYFPLTVHVAETGHFMNITNRPGNVHDSKSALTILKSLRRQLKGYKLRFRGDSAFCTPAILDYFLSHGIGFALKAPFWRLKSLKEGIKNRKRWQHIDRTWSYYWAKDVIDKSEYSHDVLVLRKKIKKQEQYQLDLFSPNNGVYEYSAIVTDSKEWKAKSLLAYMCGRSAQENSISELKTDFAFDAIPTNDYSANSAYLQLSQMAYNLSISMQHDMGLAQKRKKSLKKTRRFQTNKMKTLRWKILNRAGKIVKIDGKKKLVLSDNQATKNLYQSIQRNLESFEKAA